MPRFLPDPVTAAEMVQYLKTGDDFSMEMRVLRACIDSGFGATHGGTYQDPITGKDRQFDIRATISQGARTVKLAVECKNIKSSFPLLVSRVPRRLDEAYQGIIISKYNPGLPIQGSAKDQYCFDQDTIYGLEPQIAKATIQLGKNEKKEWVTNDAEVYEKWAQAVSSSVELIRLSCRDNDLMKLNKAATIVIPVLVLTNGTLFAADYTDHGTLVSVNPIEECYLYLGKKVVFDELKFVYRISHLAIFTEDKFTEFLNRVSKDEKYWCRLFPSSVNSEL